MKKIAWTIIALVIGGILLSACTPQTQTVEVTRVVTESVLEEVEVTRIVEGESVTETIEVTRIIEVEVPAEEEMMEEDMGPAETLRMSITSDESTLNPYTYVTGYPGWNLLTMQYDTLYQFEACRNHGWLQVPRLVRMA